MLVAVLLATYSGRAQAQGSQPYALDISQALALELAPQAATAPDDAALRLRTLAELQERDDALSHRLKGYGMGLAGSSAVVGVGFAILVRNLCLFGCENEREETLSTVGTTLMLVGTAGALVSLTGLITAGARRRRVRQRIETLTLSPMASVSQRGTVGGASLQLTW